MKTKRELYKCDVCGKKAMLPAPKPRYRNYCDCHPAAPFYMHPVKGSKQLDALVSGFLGGLGRAVGR